MIRIPGRIPITIHGAFWILAALIGFLNSHSIVGTLIWMAIILISVLFHELGHALTALAFKQNMHIIKNIDNVTGVLRRIGLQMQNLKGAVGNGFGGC